jgi:cytochrome c biogenesis protein CcdA
VSPTQLRRAATGLGIAGRRRAWGPAVMLVALLAASHIAGSGPSAAQSAPPVTIYFNGSCHDCVPYLDHELVPLLQTLGVGEIVRRDYILERRYRRELLDRSTALGIPPQMQGHMTIFMGDRIVLQGHVPQDIVRDLFAPANAARYERVVVLQDRMTSHGDTVTTYTVWTPGGAIVTYPLREPVATYLATVSPAPVDPAGAPSAAPRTTGPGVAPSGAAFMTTVLSAGLLDGINPCAFSVLLFFVAFLFTLQRDRTDLLRFGLIYVGAIYVTYLGIGLGLLKVFQLGAPHLFAKLGAWMMVVLGLVNVKDYFWYGIGPSLTVPKVGAAARDRWMRRATLPATAVVGFLVGICEFPCTGGVYVGILGLLAAQTTFATGLGYLLLYNVMFVAPLVALLLLIGNRRVVGQFSRWMASHKRQLRLGQGLVMMAIAAAILFWFV